LGSVIAASHSLGVDPSGSAVLIARAECSHWTLVDLLLRRYVKRRIWRVYRRESKVIHPPVAVDSFYNKPAEDYYLLASELVAYKRVELAVRAFARNGRRLRVAGSGPEYKRLRQLAAPNIEFCGWVPDGELRELFARCRAFLMPGEEDFGIAPVEALAAGKPVIALGRGGVLETVPLASPVGGVFFDEPTVEHLQAAVERLDKLEVGLRPGELQAHARQFSEAEFARKMSEVLGARLPPSPCTAG
jgi:glycosyltransferase involved in cell wall biosynthesis